MNADQKEEFKALFTNFLTTTKGDLVKKSAYVKQIISVADASVCRLDNFRRTAKLNNSLGELHWTLENSPKKVRALIG